MPLVTNNSTKLLIISNKLRRLLTKWLELILFTMFTQRLMHWISPRRRKSTAPLSSYVVCSVLNIRDAIKYLLLGPFQIFLSRGRRELGGPTVAPFVVFSSVMTRANHTWEWLLRFEFSPSLILVPNFKIHFCQGTNNLREVATDVAYSLVPPLVPGVAWGSAMHKGFNEGLFGTFKTPDGPKVAFGRCIPSRSFL
jgi:hypothetical protein